MCFRLKNVYKCCHCRSLGVEGSTRTQERTFPLPPGFHPCTTGKHTCHHSLESIFSSYDCISSCLTLILRFSLPRRLLKSELGSFITDYFQVSLEGPSTHYTRNSHTNREGYQYCTLERSSNAYSYVCCSDCREPLRWLGPWYSQKSVRSLAVSGF